MMSDPISDFLTRIRNGLHAGHKAVSCPSSQIKEDIAGILQDQGYIHGYEVRTQEGRPKLFIELKYDQENAPIIEGIQRVSRPGLRIYRNVNDLPKIRAGMGCAVISTSRGVMTDVSARQQNVGGEVICKVW